MPYMPAIKGEVAVRRWGMYHLVYERLRPTGLGDGQCQGFLLYAYGTTDRWAWEADRASEGNEYVRVDRCESERVARALEGAVRSDLGALYDQVVALAPFGYTVRVNGRWIVAPAPGWAELLKEIR